MAPLRMAEAGAHSTRKVLSPASTRSPAPPSRVCTASTGESTSRDAGTSAPTCASTAATHVARRSVDFPPMFGPVSNIAGGDDAEPPTPRAAPRTTSLGTTDAPTALDAPRPAPAEATAHGCHSARVKHRRAVRTGDVNSRATDGSARRRRERRQRGERVELRRRRCHRSPLQRVFEERREETVRLALSRHDRGVHRVAVFAGEARRRRRERSRGADALEVFPRSTRAPDPTRGHSMASAHATRDASAASLTRAASARRRVSADARARAPKSRTVAIVSLAATIAAASAATRRVCLAARGSAGARARPTRTPRTPRARVRRIVRGPARVEARVAIVPPPPPLRVGLLTFRPSNAATASCRSATRAGDRRSGAAIQRRRVLDPAVELAEQHASTRERRLPSARPSAVTRSSRSRSVGPSNRTRSLGVHGVRGRLRRRERRRASQTVEVRRERRRAPRAADARREQPRNATPRLLSLLRPDRPDPVYLSFVSSARKKRATRLRPTRARARRARRPRRRRPRETPSSARARRPAARRATRATRAAALTPPRRVTTSAGAAATGASRDSRGRRRRRRNPRASRTRGGVYKANPTGNVAGGGSERGFLPGFLPGFLDERENVRGVRGDLPRAAREVAVHDRDWCDDPRQFPSDDRRLTPRPRLGLRRRLHLFDASDAVAPPHELGDGGVDAGLGASHLTTVSHPRDGHLPVQHRAPDLGVVLVQLVELANLEEEHHVAELALHVPVLLLRRAQLQVARNAHGVAVVVGVRSGRRPSASTTWRGSSHLNRSRTSRRLDSDDPTAFSPRRARIASRRRGSRSAVTARISARVSGLTEAPVAETPWSSDRPGVPVPGVSSRAVPSSPDSRFRLRVSISGASAVSASFATAQAGRSGPPRPPSRALPRPRKRRP